MSISRIGSGTVPGPTITIPGTYAAGDLIVVIAGRANTTAPTVPAGWVTFSTAGASNVSLVIACRYAQSASESAPTFTNAGVLLASVYRGSVGPVQPSTGTNAAGATSATINYPGVANYRPGVTANWYLGAVAQATTANALETAPSGMANVGTDSITGLEVALHDTNADQLSNWSSTNVVLANSAAYRSATLQLTEMTYPAASGGGGLILPRSMSGGYAA
jgi:hypothetical protein